MTTEETARSPNFIDEIIAADVAAGLRGGRVQTRFPPEPNGYLHIGHAIGINLAFGMADKYGGVCTLRFDDTNPTTEDVEYVSSIQEDIRWLGFEWGEHLAYASDYFEQLFQWAVRLVEKGLAYVDDSSLEQMRARRSGSDAPDAPSPWRERPVAENLDLLHRMRAGEFPDGSRVLRARIDLASPNPMLRDPLLYRIVHAAHHRTGTAWPIYPMYDWAHGQSDAIEGVTHSTCSLEFDVHRPLYDWFLQALEVEAPPRQYEYGRLNLSYTVLSKRWLLHLVQKGHVSGWDDPRMPTLCGLRRRGYSPAALRAFCDRVGISKRDGVVDVTLLEHAVREDLNVTSPRVMAVLDPLKVVITNYPEEQEEIFDAPYFPDSPEMGSRPVPFCRELYVEREDFLEEAPRKWFRLAPGQEVRLRYACLIRCQEVVKDAAGHVIELRCTWDPESRGGQSPDGRKVKGTIHWVSARHALTAEVRLYDRLFKAPEPRDVPQGVDWLTNLNEGSVQHIAGCLLEPSLASAAPESRWQFERLGYFCADRHDSRPGALVFNRTIALRDSWAKAAKQG
ncbi:MAG: glutamine--tRNA ligase/YqeY domain fusion protein [Pseudomonadota bacterium]